MDTNARNRFSCAGSRRRLRRLFVAIAGAFLIATLVSGMTVRADHMSGAMPTEGGPRAAGPVGWVTAHGHQRTGVAPVSIVIETAYVDAFIEPLDIVDGVMESPTGPWVVSWYQETARLGEASNVVFAGHVDSAEVGPAVFANLGSLVEGDRIVVMGVDDKPYAYEVEWLELVSVEDLTPEELAEYVGPTDGERLTLITCGGEFDSAIGEYKHRLVVRAAPVEA